MWTYHHRAHPQTDGVLVNNVFSFGDTSGRGGTSYSLMTINPFINRNFGGGWFIGSAPIATASWDAAARNGPCRSAPRPAV